MSPTSGTSCPNTSEIRSGSSVDTNQRKNDTRSDTIQFFFDFTEGRTIIKEIKSSRDEQFSFFLTWMAVRAATMAGLPNPWVMSEKCVKWRWMFGSRIICGRVLHSGDLSWLSKSISSLVICLERKAEKVKTWKHVRAQVSGAIRSEEKEKKREKVHSSRLFRQAMFPRPPYQFLFFPFILLCLLQ